MVGGIKDEKASFDISPPTLNSMTALCFTLYILRCHGDTVHSANFRTSHSTSLDIEPEAGTTCQKNSQGGRDKQSADQNIKQISISQCLCMEPYATTVLAYLEDVPPPRAKIFCQLPQTRVLSTSASIW